MFFIPGWLISLVTFPGVIAHEIAHQFFCRLAKVAVLDVKYFQFSNPAGYVIHEIPRKTSQHLLIGLGPLFVNTIAGALIAFPAILPTLNFGSSNPIDMVLIWLGFSIAMHSFPSTGDAKSIWAAVMRPGVNAIYKIIAVPIVGLLYLGAIGSVFWLDAIYGAGVVMVIPTVLFN
ncbi:MAG: DUF3267 domain-containing protein [Nitrospirae bacterium]|nr:DUF3267 domain-containing protein [Nitrospirota bacterium]